MGFDVFLEVMMGVLAAHELKLNGGTQEQLVGVGEEGGGRHFLSG